MESGECCKLATKYISSAHLITFGHAFSVDICLSVRQTEAIFCTFWHPIKITGMLGSISG